VTPTQYQIRQVRLDLPMKTTWMYFFVRRSLEDSDPWWAAFYEFLVESAPKPLEWQYEPGQGIYLARPELTNEQRADIIAFARTAPAQQIAEVPSLRRAVNLPPDKVERLKIAYFADVTRAEPAGAFKG